MRTAHPHHVTPAPTVYPCLMLGTTTKSIYLMQEHGKGTRLTQGTSPHPVGQWCDGLMMHNMEPYRGVVTIDSDA